MSANVYKRLINLIPSSPLQVGTVLSSSGGVLTLQLPGGSTTTARGSAGVGTRVFFQGGTVQGVAPNLTTVVIDV